MVAEGEELIVEQTAAYVSRGGLKLENGLDALGLEVSGRSCLDVGASTGGFTDCLLQRGAQRVAAVDVGYGLLDSRLRDDERVAVIERVNARSLEPKDLPFVPELATLDVSFISLRKVMPAVAGCLAQGGELLALVKPQFELGRGRVGKGGVVRSAEDRREAILAVAEAAGALGLPVRGFAIRVDGELRRRPDRRQPSGRASPGERSRLLLVDGRHRSGGGRRRLVRRR
jgi:23S rRNA (cytidine1920-2'-O)/16S rRNA (cytidine1409-2'-O)-methyltransferase